MRRIKALTTASWNTMNAFRNNAGLRNAIGKTMQELVPGMEGHWAQTYGRVALTGEPIRFIEGSEVMGRWFECMLIKQGTKTAIT
jgi:hypothetical protein